MSTWFISGHHDMTHSEFVEHLTPLLGSALAQPPAQFIVSDAFGADRLAQEYLAAAGATVRVYHTEPHPLHNAGGWPTVGPFETVEAMDIAMTEASEADIAWVRPGRADCRAGANLARRAGPVVSLGGRLRAWLGL